MFSKSKKVKSLSSGSGSDRASLPSGAEAALWSIVEVIPDPRNHLALTKDPTAEVRLTREAIDEALARVARDADEAANPSEPDSWLTDLPTVADPTPAWPTRQSTGVRWSADTAEVHLPSLSAPQTASADQADGDASVHPIESAPTPDRIELPVQRRYARGA